MSAHPHETGAWASRMTRNTLGLAAWTALGRERGPRRVRAGNLWNNQPAPTLVAIAFSVLVGVGMLFANERNLQELDELQRTIQLEAMAWSLGAGLVGGVAWTLFARRDPVGFEAEISHLVVFMSVVAWPGASPGCCATHEEPAQGAARWPRLDPGRSGAGAGGLAADRQRHRNRQVRPEPAVGVQAGAAIRTIDRGHLPGPGRGLSQRAWVGTRKGLVPAYRIPGGNVSYVSAAYSEYTHETHETHETGPIRAYVSGADMRQGGRPDAAMLPKCGVSSKTLRAGSGHHR